MREIVIQPLLIHTSLAQKKGILLKLQVDENVPLKIMTYKRNLVQILLRLVNNAVKYTENGSVGIFVSYEPDLNTVPLELQGSSPVIQYLDDDITGNIEFWPDLPESEVSLNQLAGHEVYNICPTEKQTQTVQNRVTTAELRQRMELQG